LRLAADDADRGAAHVRAVQVEADALGELGDVRFRLVVIGAAVQACAQSFTASMVEASTPASTLKVRG